jgi:hypothetical protein
VKIKIDENNTITGYFKLISEKPYRATGCNMQRNDKGIEIDESLLNQIVVGESKFIDGEIVNEIKE